MSKTTTEMQLVAVSKLIPYVNNARTHSAEQIMKLRSSLREFGFINPVIIDREYNVIAGHGRILAANAIVIDIFGGSGSTLLTCEKTNRICYTMELDEKYASVILRRYVEDTGDAENVLVIRNGEKIAYSDLVKEVEGADGE